MKYFKLFIIAALVCVFSIAAVSFIPANGLSKGPAKLKPKATNLDCKWECNVDKKQCTCTGKDCQICTGKKSKAYGAPIVVGIQVCKRNCFWECTGSVNHQCVEWTRKCVTV